MSILCVSAEEVETYALDEGCLVCGSAKFNKAVNKLIEKINLEHKKTYSIPMIYLITVSLQMFIF